MDNLTELKRLAEAATQGPWSYDGSYVCPARVEKGTTYVETWRSVADCAQPENTKFIAAANPATVLALIAENESAHKHWQNESNNVQVLVAEVSRLKAENEPLRKALRNCADELSAEIICKHGGQKLEDMHPVTRRLYERDMAAVVEARAAMSKGEQP